MSLNKRIESGKEHRKPYRGSKNFDYSCRNHGGCPWCEGNRLYNDRVKREKSEEELTEFKKYYYL